MYRIPVAMYSDCKILGRITSTVLQWTTLQLSARISTVTIWTPVVLQLTSHSLLAQMRTFHSCRKIQCLLQHGECWNIQKLDFIWKTRCLILMIGHFLTTVLCLFQPIPTYILATVYLYLAKLSLVDKLIQTVGQKSIYGVLGFIFQLL